MSEDLLTKLQEELENSLAKKPRDEDPEMTGSGIMPDGQARIGVLLRILTAVQEEKEYRQALILSDFLDDDEADRVAAAIEERRRYGCSIAPVLDWCAARCGVNKIGHGKSRATLAIEGLTHSTFTTNSPIKNKKEKKED